MDWPDLNGTRGNYVELGAALIMCICCRRWAAASTGELGEDGPQKDQGFRLLQRQLPRVRPLHIQRHLPSKCPSYPLVKINKCCCYYY